MGAEDPIPASRSAHKIISRATMRNPRDFFKPLAVDAPDPVREIPFRPSRMIHFLDFSNEKMVAKAPDIAPKVDILLGNLEDAVPVDRKEEALSLIHISEPTRLRRISYAV